MPVSEESRALFSPAFVALTFANFAFSLAGAFALHLPGFLSQLGAREAELGRILAVLALTAALLGPVAGRIMDRRGRRVVMRVGALLVVAAAVGYLAVDRIGAFLYAVRVIDGAGSTLLYATSFTYAAELVPVARRTQGIALFGASGMVPMAISSELGDLILAEHSYHELFLVSLAFCVAGAVLCWRLPESAPASSQHPEHHGLLRIALQRDLIPIWCGALAFFCCMGGVLSFLKTFVLATGRGSVGGFFGVYVLVALTLRVAFGSLPDRVGPRRMVLPAIGSYALGTFVLAHADSNASVLLAGAICGVGHGYGFPVLLSLVIARAQPAVRGTATGIYSSIDWLGSLLTPPLLGLGIERAGYPVAFAMLSAFSLLGVVTFYALDRGERVPSVS